MRKIGINLHAKKGLSTKDFARVAHDLGFSTVFSMPKEPEIMLENAEHLAAVGINYETLHAPFKGINAMWLEGEEGDAMLQKLTDCVDMCVSVGAPIAVVHLSSGNTPPPPTDIGRGRFIRLVDYAIRKGIKIAFENQRKLHNIAWAFEEFQDTETVGFCWDCGHESCFTPGRHYMPLFGDRLICTHIHDNSGIYNADEHLLPFDGHMDFEYVANTIKASSYTGSLMLEIKGNSDFYADLSVEAFLEKAAVSVKRLRDMIDGEQTSNFVT